MHGRRRHGVWHCFWGCTGNDRRVWHGQLCQKLVRIPFDHSISFMLFFIARGWLLYAPAFGSQLFNLLFGMVYDQEARKQGTHLCKGLVCFQQTFIIGILVSALCLVVLTWAIVKMRLYKPTATSSS